MSAAELRVDQLDHLSHSSVALYAECGRAWKARYLQKLHAPMSPALVIGNVFDQALERCLRAQLAGEAPEPIALWRDEWAATIIEDGRRFRRIDRDTGEVKTVAIDWQGELPEQVENAGAKLAASAATRELLGRLRVRTYPSEGGDRVPALQYRVDFRVPGVPVPAIGYLDVIEEDGVPADFKTAGRSWPDDKPRHEIQPRIYLAALLQQGYAPPTGPNGGFLFRHYVWVKNKDVKLQTFETEFSAAELFVAGELVRQAWAGITAGVFMPNPRSWGCNSQCPAWSQCMGRR